MCLKILLVIKKIKFVFWLLIFKIKFNVFSFRIVCFTNAYTQAPNIEDTLKIEQNKNNNPIEESLYAKINKDKKIF